MPEPLTTYIDDCYNKFWDAKNECYSIGTYLQSAGYWFADEQDIITGGSHLKTAGTYAKLLADVLHARETNYVYWLIKALRYIDVNWPAADPYELTMSKILAAIWAATPAQCLLFIPMIDAMRGAISEKTVTVEVMSAAMRHFAE